MTKGLYVDFWRNPGLHSVEEMQALNSYCVANGISDVYVHYKKDKATLKMMYFLEHSGFYYLNEVFNYLTNVNLHLWLPILLLYRKANAIEIPAELKTMEHGGKVYLDPVDGTTRDYIVNYINSFASYPFIGLHLDRLWYPMMSDVGIGTRQDKIDALTDIVRRVKEANPLKIITVPILTYDLLVPKDKQFEFGLNDWQDWITKGYINKVVPAILGTQSWSLDHYLEKARLITDTIAVFYDNQEAIDKAQDMNINLMSYGVM